MLPALASPGQLAGLLGLTEGDMVGEVLARAQAALNAASSNVRDACGGRTFLAPDNTVVAPDRVLTIVLDAARRGFILYGTDGAYTSTESNTSDDFTESTTRSLDATVIAGAELTPAELATCARIAVAADVTRRTGAWSVPLGTPW